MYIIKKDMDSTPRIKFVLLVLLLKLGYSNGILIKKFYRLETPF